MSDPVISYHTERHTDLAICRACGGACCQSIPGIYHPKDLERIYNEPISADIILKMFLEKNTAVDWWEGDPRPENKYYWDDEGNMAYPLGSGYSCVYFLRPKGIKAKHKLRDASWGANPCVHFKFGHGCQLDPEKMPLQCRALVPHIRIDPADGQPVCGIPENEKATKQDLCIAWIPYQEMITEAMEKHDSLI